MQNLDFFRLWNLRSPGFSSHKKGWNLFAFSKENNQQDWYILYAADHFEQYYLLRLYENKIRRSPFYLFLNILYRCCYSSIRCTFCRRLVEKSDQHFLQKLMLNLIYGAPNKYQPNSCLPHRANLFHQFPLLKNL